MSRVFLPAAAAMLLALACGPGQPAPVAKRATPAPSPSQSASPDVSPSPAADAQQSGTAPPVGCPTSAPAVTGAAQLVQALKSAAPGTVIRLAAGTYQGQFVASVSGTAAAPITLCGPRAAVIDGGGVDAGYAVHLDGASYWRLLGFTIQGGQKGVMTDHANHVLISGLYVHGVGDEAVHLRSASSDDIVENVVVRDTGHVNTKFGEGIYIGSAHSNWCKYSACGPDMSDRDVIRNNDISQTTAENIDIKEGTTGGVVSGNRLSGTGMVESAATAWVNAKGNAWTITGNIGTDSLKDGFQVHRVSSGWGEQNVFRGNQATVNAGGYGYYVQSKSLGTVVGCDNTAAGAGSGLSNVKCG
jgi:copper-binding protein NosD